MPIFELSAPETVRLLSGHIFAQKCIKFHTQPSGFHKIFSGEKPRTLANRGGEGKG